MNVMNIVTERVTQLQRQLHETHRRFMANEITSVQHGDQREKILAEFLNVLAAMNKNRSEHRRIDANGEFNFAIYAEGQPWGPNARCGRYGKEVAKLLNTVPFRTGIIAHTGYVDETDGWGRLNHFDVERMLNSFFTVLGDSDDTL